MTALLVVLALGFAFSIGAHYTGACMGMPHALRAISERRALWVMAPLALVGATFASHGVEHTVGRGLLVGAGLSVSDLCIVVGVAFGLTAVFNWVRIPTSTIQVLVFSAVGTGLGAGVGVQWWHIVELGVVWVTAPVAAIGLGFVATKLFVGVPERRGGSLRAVAVFLVGVGALASFTMGANDVANATGSLVGSRVLGPMDAGVVGGLALAGGVLTWGRPLLRRVAFDIVTVDLPMATAAQLVQGAVVLCAVAFGFFTSMNQALIGAMVGAGLARDRKTVHNATLFAILRGWVIGPAAAVASAYGVALLVVVAREVTSMR